MKAYISAALLVLSATTAASAQSLNGIPQIGDAVEICSKAEVIAINPGFPARTCRGRGCEGTPLSYVLKSLSDDSTGDVAHGNKGNLELSPGVLQLADPDFKLGQVVTACRKVNPTTIKVN